MYSGVKTENTQSAKNCLNFNFRGGGVLWSQTENIKSAKICLNFNFFWGGGASLVWNLKFQREVLWRIWTQIFLFEVSVQKPACASQIVSHILRMWRLTSQHQDVLQNSKTACTKYYRTTETINLKRINDKVELINSVMSQPSPLHCCDKPHSPSQKRHWSHDLLFDKTQCNMFFLQDKATLKLESKRYFVLSLCD